MTGNYLNTSDVLKLIPEKYHDVWNASKILRARKLGLLKGTYHKENERARGEWLYTKEDALEFVFKHAEAMASYQRYCNDVLFEEPS